VLDAKYTARQAVTKPLGEEMEFFRRHNEVLFNKLEKKMLDLEVANQKLKVKEEALQKDEEFLDSIIENIPDMIFVKEAETLRFVRFNKAGEKLLGHNREDLIGKTDHECFPESQANFFREKDREVLDKKQLVDIPEEHIQTMHLGERILHTKKIPIIEREGKMHYLLGISEDVTEHVRTEKEMKKKDEEMRNMTQQLWQAAKLATMGELTASIAHELNNPLATISLWIELLQQQVPQEDPMQKALEVMEEETGRMGNLVASLLEFSRRSYNQISTVDVSGEIDKTLELIHYHFRKHQIQIQRDFSPDVPSIHIDRQQLRQLFMNLFTNASDAMPDGGTLTVRLYTQAAPGGQNAETPSGVQVAIDIIDTGEGITPEDLPKIFDSFFTTKPKGKGTGLGLAICRRIAGENRGTLDIESTPGKGTTVHIMLPGNQATKLLP
jgi:PAS domain S-box-containing protein